MTKFILYLLFAAVLSGGCAHVSKDGRTFVGWGSAKFGEDGKIVEITSDPPIKIDLFRK